VLAKIVSTGIGACRQKRSRAITEEDAVLRWSFGFGVGFDDVVANGPMRDRKLGVRSEGAGDRSAR